MPQQIGILSQETQQAASAPASARKRVLVFSPDSDLARFLLLNLEDEFQIVREHKLEDFERAVKEFSPDLIVIDLFTFSSDILKQLDIVRRSATTVPLIALRAYMYLTPEMTKSIEDLTDAVFYKPVDVELITQAIEDLLK